MNLPRIKILWPQRIAVMFLLVFFAQCLYVIGRTPLTETDYRYALCGREMWEKPAPAVGYFTTCGNMQGDGTLAYRVAGLPLTLNILALRAVDAVSHNKDASPVTGATYDLRHQLVGIPYLLRVPFALFAVWIGSGVWWVSRRLFGNLGGFFALGLFCFSPQIVHYATTPNNEILALWGLYGLVYTAIGIAHAMYGPPHKWKLRLYLFTFALGMTAAAHILAAIIGWIASVIFLFYVAEKRRAAIPQVIGLTTAGAIVILFASFAFRIHAFLYIFSGGAARIAFTLEPARRFFTSLYQFPTVAAFLIALVLYLLVKRSRYFGNTAPLLISLVLLPLATTQVPAAPWFWALPFLFTFSAGVFADALETKSRKLYLVLCGMILLAQAALCWIALPGIHASTLRNI